MLLCCCYHLRVAVWALGASPHIKGSLCVAVVDTVSLPVFKLLRTADNVQETHTQAVVTMTKPC